MTEVTRVRVETPVMHTVRVFEPQPVKVSVLVGGNGTPLDPADFATAVQGALADTAVQPGDIPTEIWNVKSFVNTETFEGIVDQSAYGGPTLVAGDRVVAVPNGGLALVYEVAEGPWTLIHTAAVGDHFQITWDQFTGFYGLFSCVLFVQTESGAQFVNQGYLSILSGHLSNLSAQANDLSDRIDAVPTEIWNVETIVDGTYPDNEGIPDQSAVGGPTLVAGDRACRDDGLIYEVAEGPWTLIHTMVEGDHVQVLWDSYTDDWQPYSSLLMVKNSHGTLTPVGEGYLGYIAEGFGTLVNGVVDRIDDEADARTAADTALSEDITNQVGNEATDRTLADAALSDAIAAAISQEVADRTAAITAAIDALVGGAPGTLDTLVELAAALEGQMADLASLLTLIGTKETPAGAQAKVDIETGNRIAAVSAAIAAAAVDATTKADAAQAAAIAAAAVDATTKANAAVVTAAAAAQVIADAKVEDAIVNGVTTKAPSQNAVYDALLANADEALGFALMLGGM